MTTAWILGSVSLFVTTVGALLIFLYLCNSPRSPEDWQAPEGRIAYARHRGLLIVGVGLLSAWLVVQDLALILL